MQGPSEIHSFVFHPIVGEFLFNLHRRTLTIFKKLLEEIKLHLAIKSNETLGCESHNSHGRNSVLQRRHLVHNFIQSCFMEEFAHASCISMTFKLPH